ncbi:MAG: histidinol phosphate phosphatase domain-containing protein [Thermodesulfobacteriota bacterium]
MIDLHTHTLFSDGELLPAELVRRAIVIGYQAIGLTDHADSSNLDLIVPRIVEVCRDLNRYWPIKVVPGVELTHLPPELIAPLTDRARALGAQIVVVHGETIAEPVPPGTNQQAILAGVDILAHPGLISAAEAALAKEKGVLLEITSRSSHSLTNGHVAKVAIETGANLILNTDTHAPGDLISDEKALRVVLGAGLQEDHFQIMLENARQIIARVG